jgi:hypothetical protein
LIEKHVRERKEKAGLPGARRGKEAAALDAAGAALGSFGLTAFGLVIWLMTAQSPAWALVLAAACSLRLVSLPSRCSDGGCGDGCRRLSVGVGDQLLPLPLIERTVRLCGYAVDFFGRRSLADDMDGEGIAG